jgi:hypothetical protein
VHFYRQTPPSEFDQGHSIDEIGGVTQALLVGKGASNLQCIFEPATTSDLSCVAPRYLDLGLAVWLEVFLQTVPESVLRDSVLRFSRTRASRFLVRGAIDDRIHD